MTNDDIKNKNTTEFDSEVAQIANDMNLELGLYIPADAKPNEILEYEEFFLLCRKLYYIFGLVDKKDVEELFIDFYHRNLLQKEERLNELKNRVRLVVEGVQERFDEDPDAYSDYLTDLYLSRDDKQERANLLFFWSRGYIPNTVEETEIYKKIVEEIDEDLNSVIAVMNSQEQVDDVGEEKEYSPEVVVSRYLKGSGIYDPALRNTGFRVDTDIENIRTKL